ncbi:hypothetical protein TRSC58_01764 [Trypanosoma rangeli SC58]|uniref:Uncharacterized protein n=1 Tax=Trypanosoma rangeli SC58 TaxID=429131 RepID=A0A061J508_TRYRA|nr:hypothetical protein TRSC58_01764 [Trypanosoma rangeli SC58]
MISMKFTGLYLRGLRRMQPTCTWAVGRCLPCLCAWRAMKSRSLAPDDPFGEKSAASDPSDGFYAAWSGVDIDAFADAAASDEVRTAHFGPEWARFTTVGRVLVKKMKEQKAQGADFATSVRDGDEATLRPLTAEELHARELQARRRQLERNYETYEDYVAKELGIEEEGAEDDHVEDAMDDERDVEDASVDAMPLPQFMLWGGRRESPSGTATRDFANGKQLLRNREGLQAHEALVQKVLNALGEPHGNRHLPRSDPLHWNTEEVILWITKMEAASFSIMSAKGPDSGEATKTGLGEAALAATPLMEDPSMREAFRVARADGQFLLHHTAPSTMFQVMRRWYLWRQEISLTILKEHQNMKKTVGTDMDDTSTATFRDAVESGRAKLDGTAAKVTPLLIQETISQCYLYCH